MNLFFCTRTHTHTHTHTHRNQLVTKEPLDHEKINRYTLRLFVTDLGDKIMEIDGSAASASGSSINDVFYESVTDLPTDHVDFIDVVVYVLDENDNAPLFVDGITGYEFDVVEEQPANTTVGFANVRSLYLKHFSLHSSIYISFYYRQQMQTLVFLGLFDILCQVLIMKSMQHNYKLQTIYLQLLFHCSFTVDDVSGEIFTAGPINREKKDTLVKKYYDNCLTTSDKRHWSKDTSSILRTFFFVLLQYICILNGL